MTIGPAPMIIMVWISSRFGITPTLLQQRQGSPTSPNVGRSEREALRVGGFVTLAKSQPKSLFHLTQKKALARRAGSTAPAERALLYRIYEGHTRLHRFGPSLLQPVVPYRRHIRVLN